MWLRGTDMPEPENSKKIPMATNTLDHTKKLDLEKKYILLNEKYLF